MKELLGNEKIQEELPKEFFDTLMGGFSEKKSNKMKVKVIADALALIQNPLIIVELKSNPTEKKSAPTSSVFLCNEFLQNRELCLLTLFPNEKKNLGGDTAGTSSKKQKIIATGGTSSKNQKAIDWMKMCTDFPLDRLI